MAIFVFPAPSAHTQQVVVGVIRLWENFALDSIECGNTTERRLRPFIQFFDRDGTLPSGYGSGLARGVDLFVSIRVYASSGSRWQRLTSAIHAPPQTRKPAKMSSGLLVFGVFGSPNRPLVGHRTRRRLIVTIPLRSRLNPTPTYDSLCVPLFYELFLVAYPTY